MGFIKTSGTLTFKTVTAHFILTVEPFSLLSIFVHVNRDVERLFGVATVLFRFFSWFCALCHIDLLFKIVSLSFDPMQLCRTAICTRPYFLFLSSSWVIMPACSSCSSEDVHFTVTCLFVCIFKIIQKYYMV